LLDVGCDGGKTAKKKQKKNERAGDKEEGLKKCTRLTIWPNGNCCEMYELPILFAAPTAKTTFEGAVMGVMGVIGGRIKKGEGHRDIDTITPKLALSAPQY